MTNKKQEEKIAAIEKAKAAFKEAAPVVNKVLDTVGTLVVNIGELIKISSKYFPEKVKQESEKK